MKEPVEDDVLDSTDETSRRSPHLIVKTFLEEVHVSSLRSLVQWIGELLDLFADD